MSIEKVAIGSVCVGGTCAAGYGVYEFSKAKDLRDLLFEDEPLDGNEEGNIWSGLATKYESDTEQSSSKFSGFSLVDPSTNNQNKSKADQLKDKCLEALKTSVSDKEKIEELKGPTKTWCTKKSDKFPTPPVVDVSSSPSG